MKINTIINRYIFSEFIPPFIINLCFFTFIFLMTKILEITNLVVNYKISFSKIMLFLFYNMPYFMTFVIPMSVMMAILLTFLRLSSDNEVLALKSSGVSLYGLLPPVLCFCMLGCLMTALMTLYGMPWGQVSVKRLVQDLATSNLNIGIKERTFNNSFDGMTLYVNRVDLKNDVLNDIFIEDQRDRKITSTIVSPLGKLYTDPESLSAYLQLNDGIINQVNLQNKTVNTVRFESYRVMLPIKKEEKASRGNKPKDEKRMGLKELWTAIHNTKIKDTQHYKYRIEFQNKFSIPFACFTLGILALPLGVQSKAKRQSYGLGLGLTFFLIFYLLLSLGWMFGKTGYYPPEIGIWMPNIVMGILAFIFLLITVNEGPINIFSTFIDYFKGKIRKRKS